LRPEHIQFGPGGDAAPADGSGPPDPEREGDRIESVEAHWVERRRRSVFQLDVLAGHRCRIPGSGVPSDYATALLDSLGAEVERVPRPTAPHPALEWARSGAMALSGLANGAPLLAPGPLASCAAGTLDALRSLAKGLPRALDGAALLGERAAILGLVRRGRVSPGGSCHLLRAGDAWIAASLARPEDVASLPAWLEREGPFEDPWRFVARHAAECCADELARRAAWLGLPVAVAGPPPSPTPPWLRVAIRGTASLAAVDRRPLVVDLSSLWAGPLCTHLLGLAGARVVKLESVHRPDGARRGDSRFFDLLNAGKASVVLDLRSERGRNRLREVLDRADVVVESARPRALTQLGVDAESFVASKPGRTWLSITGYGRGDPDPGRVAFGDDAAVAAGLAQATGRHSGSPLFCGDAIADPLAGLHAALAAHASQIAGGGHLLDVSLRDVVAHSAAFAPDPHDARVQTDGAGFSVTVSDGSAPVLPPRARRAGGVARPLGADTEAVCRELAC